jgi:peptidoglycan/LPS O-acetylase OafA/YrhL
MLILAFLYAASLLVLGGAALILRNHPGAGEFAYSAVFFGGSTLICAFFSINMRRHGLSAAAFLAFLAFLTGCNKVFTQLTSPPAAEATLLVPILTALLTILSLSYLAASLRAWQRSRRIVVAPD